MKRKTASLIPNAVWLAWGTVLFWAGFFHDYLLWGILWSWLASFTILNILNPRIARHPGRECLIWAVVVGLCYPLIDSVDWTQRLRDGNLDGLTQRLRDKAELQKSPSIFPRTVAEGMPQDFYVFAENTAGITLKIGNRELAGESLGHGLFRVSASGSYGDIAGETVHAAIRMGETSHERILKFHKALPHPNRSCRGPKNTAFVLSEETDELFQVTSTGVIHTRTTGNGPSACLVIENKLLVSHIYEESVWVYDLASDAHAQQILVGAPQKSMALSLDHEVIALTQQGSKPGVLLLNADTLEAFASIPLNRIPEWIAPGPTARQWLVSSRHQPSLIQLRRAQNEWQKTVHPLSRPLIGMVSDSVGAHLFALTTGYHPQGVALQGNHFVQDQILKFDSTTLALKARMLTHRRAEEPQAPGDFLKWTAGAGPSSIDWLRNGHLLIAFSGTNQWWQVKPDLSGPAAELPIRKAGLSAPHGALELSDGTLLVTSPSEGTLALFNPEDNQTRLYQLGPDDEALAASHPRALQRRQGEKAFYEATRSGRSCQSCHLHGDSDHSTHNIGDLHVRPATLSVRGIAGTAPYLRGGAYNRVRELLHVPEMLLGGYFLDDPERAMNIEAFIEGLVHPGKAQADSQERDQERERLGLDAFVKARCTACHAFPAFTDLSQHPATRLFANFPDPAMELDTPSLIALRKTPPYLFDGSAKTITEVFENKSDGSQHGEINALSAEERKHLFFFLESL